MSAGSTGNCSTVTPGYADAHTTRMAYDCGMPNFYQQGAQAALEKLALSAARVQQHIANRVSEPGVAPGWGPRLNKMVAQGTNSGGQFVNPGGQRTDLRDSLHNMSIGGLPPTSQQSQLNQRFDRAMGPMTTLNGLGNTGTDAATTFKGKGPFDESAWTQTSPLGKFQDVHGSRQPSNPRASVSAALARRPSWQPANQAAERNVVTQRPPTQRTIPSDTPPAVAPVLHRAPGMPAPGEAAPGIAQNTERPGSQTAAQRADATRYQPAIKKQMAGVATKHDNAAFDRAAIMAERATIMAERATPSADSTSRPRRYV